MANLITLKKKKIKEKQKEKKKLEKKGCAFEKQELKKINQNQQTPQA